MPDALFDQMENNQDKDSRGAQLEKKLKGRYIEKVEGNKPEPTEEELFQAAKEHQAAFKVGTAKEDKETKKYELLLDNQVDFVKADLLTGLME
jgi:hypothetical protein